MVFSLNDKYNKKQQLILKIKELKKSTYNIYICVCRLIPNFNYSIFNS